MSEAITLSILTAICLVLSAGLLYKVGRWFYCRALGSATLSRPAKVLETTCPHCQKTNLNWKLGANLMCVWETRRAESIRKGGSSLLPNHVNCLWCGAVYKVW